MFQSLLKYYKKDNILKYSNRLHLKGKLYDDFETYLNLIGNSVCIK